MAFELWLCHVKEQQRMEQVCTRIVKAMLHHSLEVGMMTWKDHVRKQQRATTVCARVVSHWLHRCIANAFESWHLHAKEQRRMSIGVIIITVSILAIRKISMRKIPKK
jgi:hypothetical protein